MQNHSSFVAQLYEHKSNGNNSAKDVQNIINEQLMINELMMINSCLLMNCCTQNKEDSYDRKKYI